MKVISCLIIISILMTTSNIILPQEYEYISFPDSNAVWSEVYYPPLSGSDFPTGHNYVVFNEDTIIESKTYHKLFLLEDTVFNRNNAQYFGAIREDITKKVYYRGQHIPADSYYEEDEEYLLYDFSLSIGDTIRNVKFVLVDQEWLVVTDIDTILFNDNYRKVFFFSYPYVRWIEGIGNDRGLLFYSGTVPSNGLWNDLICFFQEGELIYHLSEYTGCFYDDETGINEYSIKENPRISSNPIESIGILSWKPGKFNYLRITDCSGKLIINYDIRNFSEYEIIKKNFNPGIYIYQLISEEGKSFTGKFIMK